jgi:flavin prenyltransferase
MTRKKNMKRIVVGISGASGAVYAIRILEELRKQSIETHLVITKTGQITLAQEMGMSPAQAEKLADHYHNVQDFAASIASGSFRTEGMIIAPCSMRSVAEIATGITTNLLTRAAEVVLKDRRRLVVLARETPLTLLHLRNMATITEMGGIIAPPVPAFYNNPKTLDDIVTHTIGRVLDLFDIEIKGFQRWGE